MKSRLSKDLARHLRGAILKLCDHETAVVVEGMSKGHTDALTAERAKLGEHIFTLRFALAMQAKGRSLVIDEDMERALAAAEGPRCPVTPPAKAPARPAPAPHLIDGDPRAITRGKKPARVLPAQEVLPLLAPARRPLLLAQHVGEASTWCGIELDDDAVPSAIPRLVFRKGSASVVKIVTTDAYDCGNCKRKAARTEALADIAAVEKPQAPTWKRVSGGTPTAHTLLAGDNSRTVCGRVVVPATWTPARPVAADCAKMRESSTSRAAVEGVAS